MVAGQYALRLARRKGLANRDVFSEEKVAQLRGDPGGLFIHHYCIGRRNRARSLLPACSHTYQSGIDTGRLPR